MLELNDAKWFKSSRSNASGNCVEIAIALPGSRAIGIRDSKDPQGGVLTVAPDSWESFTSALKSGRYQLR